ncbi:hypothetical protein ACRQ5Q_09325 [Bradyrhizobium sp. PMVTL-01]|uniref:hypothetical protein n=1 Tax=Bradyrhizobium sp. PMVTL-01 TaxID=3434999 RepID=UPI003F71EA57
MIATYPWVDDSAGTMKDAIISIVLDRQCDPAQLLLPQLDLGVVGCQGRFFAQ